MLSLRFTIHNENNRRPVRSSRVGLYLPESNILISALLGATCFERVGKGRLGALWGDRPGIRSFRHSAVPYQIKTVGCTVPIVSAVNIACRWAAGFLTLTQFNTLPV